MCFKILVAVDGTLEAKSAFEKSMDLAKKWEANKVHLYLAAVAEETPPQAYGHYHSKQLLELMKEIDNQKYNVNNEILKELAAICKSHNIPHTTISVRGSPGDTLVKEVKAHSIDLAIVGRRGHLDTTDRFFTCSVSTHLAQKAPCSVYVTKTKKETTDIVNIHSFVLGVDGSKHSEKAVDLVEKLGGENDTAFLLHANKKSEELSEFENKYSAQYGDRLGKKGIKVEFKAIAEGDARHALCDFAKEKENSVLVVGTRGLGLLKKLFLGSTSDYCLNYAESDVLIAR